jgi:hypothetical protein
MLATKTYLDWIGIGVPLFLWPSRVAESAALAPPAWRWWRVQA